MERLCYPQLECLYLLATHQELTHTHECALSSLPPPSCNSTSSCPLLFFVLLKSSCCNPQENGIDTPTPTIRHTYMERLSVFTTNAIKLRTCCSSTTPTSSLGVAFAFFILACFFTLELANIFVLIFTFSDDLATCTAPLKIYLLIQTILGAGVLVSFLFGWLMRWTPYVVNHPCLQLRSHTSLPQLLVLLYCSPTCLY
jgi:hypothetical protein